MCSLLFNTFKLFSVLTFFSLLVACGENGSQSNPSQGNSSDVETVSLMSGSVGDGPIVGSSILIYTNDGNLLDSTVSNSTANFSVNIRTRGNSYPLLFTTQGGTDIVTNAAPDFTLTSVALKPANRKVVNINPYSTIITKTASLMSGGLNENNLSSANQYVTEALNFGLDVTLIPDPISTEIDDVNISNFIKSCEILGEAIRRTRASLSSQGMSISNNQIVDSISADLIDGTINGEGASNANVRIAATFNLIISQVSSEALVNQLRVNGVIATSALDNAILTTHPDISTNNLTHNIRINQRLIDMTKASVRAADAIDTSTAIDELLNSLNNVSANSLPEQNIVILPNDYSASLNNAIMQLGSATSTELEEINTIANVDNAEVTPPTGVNGAPELSGTPSIQVTADSVYTFTVNATDPESESISWNIVNTPQWATFTANGNSATLTGVPNDGHVGIYENIQITATDSINIVYLPAFSVEVTPAASPTPLPPAPPTADYSLSPTSGVASLTVNFTAAESTLITSYNWDFGDGTSDSGSSVAHLYTTPGSYTTQLTVTDTQGNTYSDSRTVNVFASIDNTSAIVPDGVLFYDDFDYVVNRDSANASDLFSTNGGWRWAKTQQDYGSGNGYLYTVDSIPGYTGDFPGRNSTRVLLMEARPATFGAQTDFYLQYGDTDFPADTVPGDVWFQYWIYPIRYGDQQSQFHWRNKFIYPCNGGYGCTTGKWLLYQGFSSASPYRDEIHDGSLYAHIGESRVSSIVNSNDQQVWWQNRPGQTDLTESMAVNRWTLVKIHINTTQTAGNSFEMWLKPMGGAWKKVAEWIGGVTPGFEWTIPADQVGGHRVFRMPSTMPGGGNDPLYDSWVYMDDFTMTTSEDTLPDYPY